MRALRAIARFCAWLVASAGRIVIALLIVFSFLLWALGTRGVPFTVEVAQKLMGGELTVAHAEGGLFGPIRLDGIVLDSQGSRTEIDHLQLEWSPPALWQRTVQIDRLQVGTVIVRQKPHVATPSTPLNPRLPRDVQLLAAEVAHFEWRPVGGKPLVLDALSASGSWRQQHVEIAGLQFSQALAGVVHASGEADLEPKSITIARLHVEGPATLDVTGRLGLLGEPSDLAATLIDGRWPLSGESKLRLPHLEASARGVLTGAALDAAVTIKGALRAALQSRDLGLDIDGAGQLKSGGAHIEHLRLQSTDGAGLLMAAGDAEWQPALRVEAKAKVQKLDPGVLLADWKGQLNGEFTASTRNEGELPVVDFGASLQNSRLRGYPLKLDARGTAALQGDIRRVQLAVFALNSGSTTIKAEGQVLPTLDASASINASDLGSLLPTLAGALQLAVKAKGELANPAVQAQGSAHGFRYAGTTVASADVDVDYQPSAVSRAKLLASGLALGSTRLSTVKLLADGRAEDHRITLETTLAQPKSEAALTLAGALDLKARSWQGQLQQSSFTPPYGPAWQQEAAAALKLDQTQQQLASTCWHAGKARLCLDANLAPPLAHVGYRLEQLDTRAFAALLPKGWAIETTLDGNGEIALDGRQPQKLDIDLKAGAGRIAIPGAPVLQLMPSTVVIRQLESSWQAKAAISLDRGVLDAEASMPIEGAEWADRALSGRVKVKVPDLAWLGPLLPKVQDLRGALDGDFAIAGSATAPRLEGALNLSGGSVRIEPAGLVVKDITAQVRGGNSGPLAITATATSGGTVHVDGTAEFADGKPHVKLAIKGDNVQIADIADARIWVSPDLVYTQDADA